MLSLMDYKICILVRLNLIVVDAVPKLELEVGLT
jgi:hypothetical protein